MKAMILAAGRGTRMGDVSQSMPKPLLKTQNKPLIEYHLEALAAVGYTDVVINVSHHAQLIQQTLGNGSRFGVTIHYSHETEPLGPGGGIHHALPLLGEKPFIVISGDVFTNYPLEKLPQKLKGLAHLILIDNPPNHPQGDFYLKDGCVNDMEGKKLTYSGVGVFDPKIFNLCDDKSYPFIKVLRPAISAKQITGEHHQGKWVNVNTMKTFGSLR